MATTTKQATEASTEAPVIIDLPADLSPAVAAIEKAYRLIQAEYPDAPGVTIVVKRDDRAWGHTTVAKVWAPAGADLDNAPVADRFELMISGENLRRGAEHVAATLLHEAVHARHLAAGVLDTDTNGRHNKLFKEGAEEHGLICECDRWHGWTLTKLDDAGLKRWAKLIKVIDAGLKKAAAAARWNLDHMPNAPKPAAPANGGKPTTRGAGGLRPASPPKRGNRNLLVATCGCGDKIRVSAGVLDRCQPTCQVCDEPFAAS